MFNRLKWKGGGPWWFGIDEDGNPVRAIVQREAGFQAYDIVPRKDHGWRPVGAVAQSLDDAKEEARKYVCPNTTTRAA